MRPMFKKSAQIPSNGIQKRYSTLSALSFPV